MRTVWPGLIRPSRTASSSAMGIEALEVLPQHGLGQGFLDVLVGAGFLGNLQQASVDVDECLAPVDFRLPAAKQIEIGAV